ncbi:MAG: AAA family ATPase [Chloroflexales bacterium]|nr:AAA family ATPase [Chloroflexales bacterium]
MSVPRRQARALLYRLAAPAPGAAPMLPRDHLCFLLWPDLPQSAARRNLSVVIAQLRRALPRPELVITSGDTVGLREHGIGSDAATFVALVPNALRAGSLADLAAAASLYRGPFLDGFSLPDAPEFEAWADGERQAWERRYLDTLTTLVAGYRAEGAYPEAIAAAQQALTIDPLSEELYRALIALYAAQGNRAAALRQFERCVTVLEHDLGVDPLPETRALYEAVRDGQYAASPPAGVSSSAQAARHVTAANPPIPFTPAHPPTPLGDLLGRGEELAALGALLAAPARRLITLTGPGGSGKTRLALELLRNLERDMPDGAVFVPLASLRDPALLIEVVAQACGLTGVGAPSPAAALRAALAGRRVLLVLDNMEHLLPAAPALTELLSDLPKLRLLVTSRRVLHLSGEQVFPVPPLPLPDLARLPTFDELAAQPAVALLVSRTRALNPQFALTTENAAALAAICVRLDGLPLALELAAARLRLMSAHALLRRLDRRLVLLTQGPQDLPERQRALRSVIAWSEALLDSAARTLFAAAAVFAGSWTLDAAEELGRVSGHPTLRAPQGTLDALTALVDASLVQQVVGADGEPRLALLETIREYALERLEAQGAAAQIAEAHAASYARRASQAAAGLSTVEAAAWLDRLADDEPNMLVALEHAHTHAASETVLRLLEALVRFWAVRGQLYEGRYWLERTLRPLAEETTEDSGQAARRLAMVCLMSAELFFLQGEYATAVPFLEASVARWRTLAEPGWLAISLTTLAGAHALSGELHAAAAPFAEGEAVAGTAGDDTARAWLALDYGRDARHRGQPREACRWLSEAARHYRTAGDQWYLTHTLLDLAPVLLSLGEEAAAEASAAEALAIARQLRSQSAIANALNELGEIARYRGRDSEAEAYYRESLELMGRMGSRAEAPRLRHNLAHLALRRGDLSSAAQGFAESLAAFAERRIERGVMEGLVGLAAVATAQGCPLDAARLWGAAAELAAAEHWELWPPDQLAYAGAVSQAQVQSEPRAFEAAWQEGRARSLEAARALAAEVVEQATVAVTGSAL